MRENGNAVKGSRYFESFDLYKENGFKQKEKAQELIAYLKEKEPVTGQIAAIEKKKEKKNPPLLYNLAELQNDCSKRFKISPDETLRIVQELYEKKLVTIREQMPECCLLLLQRKSVKSERAVKIRVRGSIFKRNRGYGNV